MEYIEIRHAHLFCGLGGGAKGFNQGGARYGNLKARFRCLGGVDVDKAALADFARLTGCRGTYLDMFDREQYIAFHGQEPPADWSEATPEDLHQAFGYERPHIGFLSPPCKGLSGLLSEAKSASAKYQALNRLTLRGIWLLLEAYKDDPIELLILDECSPNRYTRSASAGPDRSAVASLRLRCCRNHARLRRTRRPGPKPQALSVGSPA